MALQSSLRDTSLIEHPLPRLKGEKVVPKRMSNNGAGEGGWAPSGYRTTTEGRTAAIIVANIFSNSSFFTYQKAFKGIWVSQTKMAKKAAKKKKWFEVVAPKAFQEQIIGESTAFELRDLIGKKLTVNLMSLTNDPKKQGISITFKITSQKGDKAATEVIGYKILPSSIKRIVRRNKDRLDLTMKCKTKDKATVLLKPIVLTRNLAKGSVKTALMNKIKEKIEKEVAEFKYEDLVKQIIMRKFQKGVMDDLKKIYPLAFCDIRMLSRITEEEKNAPTEDKQEVQQV